MEDVMRRISLIALLTLVLATVVTAFHFQGEQQAFSQFQGKTSSFSPRTTSASTAYIYYVLKQSSGFVLARAAQGSSGQPLGTPQIVARFDNGFGLVESDSVFTLQCSPDGRYLAIDGARDHGEQVWMFDTHSMTLNLTPANVLGNFLHWVPGRNGHTFLYRPMLPLGPSAPFDGNTWNPGLWVVDAASGTHQNIDIRVPSALLVDAVASPDGTRMIYSTTPGLGMGSDTWQMNSDGSRITHLFSTPTGAQSIAALFSWSPDGNTIAYEHLSDSPTPFLSAGLWIMNGAGGQQRHLADADGGHGYPLAWSPDSRKIAFIVRTNTGNSLANTQAQALHSAIAVVDVSTNQSWVVASTAQTGAQLNDHPLWSADSANITFTASNPVNRVLGGTPRYWSVRAVSPQLGPAATPLTPALSGVMAVG
jgi:hypothetical protein